MALPTGVQAQLLVAEEATAAQGIGILWGKLRRGDRLDISIPYGGEMLRVFVHLPVGRPADVTLLSLPASADESMFDLETLPELAEYDSSDPRALLKVILALREAYAASQRATVAALAAGRLSFELDMLKDVPGVEMCVRGGTAASSDLLVDFVVPLWDIEEAGGPPAVFEGQRWQLALCMRPLAKPVRTTVTVLAPRRMLASWNGLSLPEFSAEDSIVPFAATFASRVASGWAARASLLRALSSAFGSCLESDVVNWRRADFLLMHGDRKSGVMVMCTVTLPIDYPSTGPQVQLELAQPAKDGRVWRNSFTEKHYPFSPRWTAEEFAPRLKAFVLEQLAVFVKAVPT
eukprot:PLAT15019.1.p1 GENE.PLAT15019.1~~PLAT15019.1.p1  ORF type:complete len:348 (-),score=129.89 PLAT15019.1:57-1100(-)